MQTQKKHRLKQLRHWRVRKKVSGTKERPRMAVCFTNTHIYVQFIDDAAGQTLASASTTSKATPDREKLSANVASAKTIGKIAAEAAIAKGIKTVVFDRGGAKYHWSKPKPAGKEGKDKEGKEGKEAQPVYGKLAALAEAARAAGLKF
jgi:large subunit ribosomal protein L18